MPTNLTARTNQPTTLMFFGLDDCNDCNCTHQVYLAISLTLNPIAMIDRLEPWSSCCWAYQPLAILTYTQVIQRMATGIVHSYTVGVASRCLSMDVTTNWLHSDLQQETKYACMSWFDCTLYPVPPKPPPQPPPPPLPSSPPPCPVSLWSTYATTQASLGALFTSSDRRRWVCL